MARTNVAILFPSGRLELTATVKQFAGIAADGGFHVDVLTIENRATPSPELLRGRLLTMPFRPGNFYESVPLVTALFALWALPRVLRNRYGLYVAAGIRGLLVATFLSMLTRTPVVYHSLELYPSWEQRSFARRLMKRFETWAMNRARAVIVQDEVRGEVLARDSGIPKSRFVYLPVSSDGPAGVCRTDYLRRVFGVPSSKKIILYAGSLSAPFACVTELIREAQDWPDDWVLVLQSNHRIIDAEITNRWTREDARRRVIFSLEPVPYASLGELTASADISVAVYHRSDDNMYYLGLSSGKVAESLRVGVPVIVNRWPGISDLVETYSCGVTVDNIADVTGAVASILSNYRRYADSAVAAFTQKLDVTTYLCSIQNVLREAVSPTGRSV